MAHLTQVRIGWLRRIIFTKMDSFSSKDGTRMEGTLTGMGRYSASVTTARSRIRGRQMLTNCSALMKIFGGMMGPHVELFCRNYYKCAKNLC